MGLARYSYSALDVQRVVQREHGDHGVAYQSGMRPILWLGPGQNFADDLFD
jgi:hypothetical protein